jgi:hypothetical protein
LLRNTEVASPVDTAAADDAVRVDERTDDEPAAAAPLRPISPE